MGLFFQIFTAECSLNRLSDTQGHQGGDKCLTLTCMCLCFYADCQHLNTWWKSEKWSETGLLAEGLCVCVWGGLELLHYS